MPFPITIPLELHGADRLCEELRRLEAAASASVEVRERLAQLGELSLDECFVDCGHLPAGRARAARICVELPQRYREVLAAVAGECG